MKCIKSERAKKWTNNLFDRIATRICFIVTGYLKLKGMGHNIEYRYIMWTKMNISGWK